MRETIAVTAPQSTVEGAAKRPDPQRNNQGTTKDQPRNHKGPPRKLQALAWLPGKAYLAGTAKEVWVPDLQTQEWPDWLHTYHKAVKRNTQMRARLRSYLSDCLRT